jgi:hypothetical protein
MKLIFARDERPRNYYIINELRLLWMGLTDWVPAGFR